MTHTRTHVQIEFADPYLVCLTCGEPVQAWHNDDACGCDAGAWNLPCEHPAGITSTCPSWSPVDGCTCAAQFGSVGHPPAP
jgi:hypothetical protein